MRVGNEKDIAEALGALRKDRQSILKPSIKAEPEQQQSMLDRYYETLPEVKRQKAEEKAAARKAALPLNGAGVLRAALAGGSGTINSGSWAVQESVASVIARELGGVEGRMDSTG